MEEVIAYRADYHPLLGQQMQQMGIVETINSSLKEGIGDTVVDTGTVVAAMIHSLLGEGPIRMYKLTRFFSDKPLPLIFPWSPHLDADQLNDDRASRALDKLWEVGPQKVFSEVSRSVIERYTLDLRALHADTTSRSFYGVYENQDSDNPQITYGYSKDHRQDLKQILFGVGTSRDGIPVAGEVCSGNMADMTWNTRWIKSVREQLGIEEKGLLVYVADSALVTPDNLDALAEQHLDFMSRLPERYGLAERLKAEALAAKDRWEDVGVIAERKEAARYHIWETERELNKRTYGFVAVYSSTLDERQFNALERGVGKEAKELEGALAELRAQRFFCLPDAQTAWESFLGRIAKAPSKWHKLSGKIEAEERRVKRAKRGRPRKDEKPEMETVYRIDVQVQRDLERYEEERQKCGMFVLITNLGGEKKEQWSCRQILAEYKGQTGVERIFRFIKNPALVGAFCLKKPERIVAFGYVVLMAAIVYTLLERQVRQALAKPAEEPVEGLDGRLTHTPTSYAIQTAFSPILVVGLRKEGYMELRPSRGLTKNQQRLLQFAGFDESIYHRRCKMPSVNSIYLTS